MTVVHDAPLAQAEFTQQEVDAQPKDTSNEVHLLLLAGAAVVVVVGAAVVGAAVVVVAGAEVVVGAEVVGAAVVGAAVVGAAVVEAEVDPVVLAVAYVVGEASPARVAVIV